MAKRLADSLNSLLGKNSEVVVHDFSDFNLSVIHVAGNVTNRKVGAPITDLAYRLLRDQSKANKDLHGYKSVSPCGRVLKSSTLFLRTDNENIIGCMCINFDMTEYLNAKAILDDFSHGGDAIEHTRNERFAHSFNETLDSLIEETISHIGKQPALMDKNERMALLEHLEQKEVFLFKGAVTQVARLLGVTRFTIYNYLKEIRLQNNQI